MLPSRSTFAALAASCFSSIAMAQLVWQPQTGMPRPAARHESALAHDPVGGGLVLFSGSSNFGELNDTWRWTGAAWQQLNPVAVPPGRFGPRLATDTARNVIVLFGGFTLNFNLPQPWVSLNDTWEWNGSNWIQRFPNTIPPPRGGHALAYDVGRGVTVMFGGTDNTATTTTWYADTWEWDGVNWTLRISTTPMPPQSEHAMAYDAARGVVVMASGSLLANRGTWEWNGITWLPRGTCPSGFGARLAYDAARERVVWYGGADNNGGALPLPVQEWDGQVWTPRPIAVSPPPRAHHVMAFEPVTEKVVVFGGRDDSQPSLQQRKDDTWTLGPVHPATTTPFGVACGGTAGPLTIATADRPWLGTTMTIDWTGTPASSFVLLAFGWSRTAWLGVPLPLPLGAIGMPGCSLLVSLDHAEARATVGSTLQQDVLLPYVAAVLGFELSLQGFGFDAAANAAGLTASNGIALTLGGL